jgi:hypothetical protein
MAEEQIEVGQDDVDAFTAKLNSWSETLEPAERALLGMMLGRASGGSEVEGYAMSNFGDAAFSFLSPLGGTAAKPKKGVEVIHIGTDDDGTWLKGGTA